MNEKGCSEVFNVLYTVDFICQYIIVVSSYTLSSSSVGSDALA